MVAGGEVAGIEALLALRELAAHRVDVTLLAPNPDLVYRPLGVVEPFQRGRMRRYPLASIAADAGARLVPKALIGVDVAARRALLVGGAEVPYDVLLLAVGARAEPVLPGAMTFAGERDAPGIRQLLDRVRRGAVGRCLRGPGRGVLALPALRARSEHGDRLPAARCAGCRAHDRDAGARPLEIFGARAARAVAELLDEHGVRLITSRQPRRVAPGRLELVPGDEVLMADAVVAAPRLEGRRIAGLSTDPHGFLPTDEHGRVAGAEHVYAAGDGTAFPIKQGGIAAQQADAAAEAIAAQAGAPIDPTPFHPVLRGLLLAVDDHRYLRADVSGGAGDSSEASDDALWWPPTKIAARYLSPYLATVHDLVAETVEPVTVPIELELERHGGLGDAGRRRAVLLPEEDGFSAFDLGREGRRDQARSPKRS